MALLRPSTLLLLAVLTLPSAAQTSPSLDAFLSQTLVGLESTNPTLDACTADHARDKLDEPTGRLDFNSEDPREAQDAKIESRWCLRSTADIILSSGIQVRRIALFYQPRVTGIYDQPLPPLPNESGAQLRHHGCGLAKILFEFAGPVDPETLASHIPGRRVEEPGHLVENPSPNDYWQPLYSFGWKKNDYFLFTHTAQHTSANPSHLATEQPSVLLAWEGNILRFYPPENDTINPLAGQPWLPLRIATLARLPEEPTLRMLSFLAPQYGTWRDQPPWHCDKDLVPVLRQWFDLAAHATPQQHVAAILLAHLVANRLSDCEEFADTDPMPPADEQAEADAYHDLKKSLSEFGIDTGKSARPGPEYYTGNLLDGIPPLAPSGIADELYSMTILDDRCPWNTTTDANCGTIIAKGEQFLSRFPPDEWTPAVQLILAEAYSLTIADPGAEDQPRGLSPDEMLRKASAHYRAWYQTSTSDHDRALVWQEIWGLDAGLGPWLLLPDQLRN